jgi:hypothetical protein
MATLLDNPWFRMHRQSTRRVQLETNHNFFWICDDQARYGLMIVFQNVLSIEDFTGQMKGISFGILDENKNALCFILQEQKDWEIFLAICNDVLECLSEAFDDIEMINSINQRIKRWQKFLSHDAKLTMPEKIQMGLYAELHVLKNVLLTEVGHRQAITSWVGPDADQKDFSLAKFFLEVKSFISSKGAKVQISSLGQLDDAIKPIYLLAYGLTNSDNGNDIPTIVNDILASIPTYDFQMLNIFEDRLASYGYVREITQPPFSRYIIDSSRCYQINQDFPRIVPLMVQSNISNVKYTLDLTQCDTFEQPLNFNDITWQP